MRLQETFLHSSRSAAACDDVVLLVVLLLLLLMLMMNMMMTMVMMPLPTAWQAFDATRSSSSSSSKFTKAEELIKGDHDRTITTTTIIT